MAKLYNLAGMSTATTGTGAITLGSAMYGHLTFAQAGVADGETITYAIKDGAASEIGRGVYTSSGTTLTRTVLKSTNSNSAISLSGSAEVFITPAAEDIIEPPSSSVDSEIVLFSGTTGDVIKRASTTGILKGANGVLSAAAAGTDYVVPSAVPGTTLLINGDFSANQRAFAGGALADGVYGFDRWKGGVSANITSTAGGITVAAGYVQQIVELAAFGLATLASTTLTLSVEDPTANVYFELTANAVTASGTITAGSGRRSETVTLAAGATGNLSVILQPVTTGHPVKRAKLEIGSTATDWVARPATVEMLLCQRYYYRIAGSILVDSYDSGPNAFYYSYVTFPARMRATPAASYTLGDMLNIYSPGGVPQAGALYHNETMGTFYMRGNSVGRMYAFINNPTWSAEL